MENHQILIQEGDCTSRHAPCSTFKIAISLMAYHEDLLFDEVHPELPFMEGYPDWISVWRQPHNPTLWIRNSCVWFSQVLTQQLGMNKFMQYVESFDYGNKDVSGDKGKNNGLTRAWLSSSLEISPEEQVIFLQKLLDGSLPVSHNSHQMTKNILFVEGLLDGWKLFGKTGSGFLFNHDRTEKLDIQMGWFIGWVEKENRSIVFAQFIEDEKEEETYASYRAKAAAREKIIKLIQNIKPS